MPSENAETLERATQALYEERFQGMNVMSFADFRVDHERTYARTAAQAAATVTAYLKAMEEAGFVMVPVEPTDELLMSMAVRYDHALAVPGYYDQPILARPGVTHAKMLDATLTSMRQVHEEVVGTGFYSTETAPRYRAMLSAKDADGREG